MGTILSGINSPHDVKNINECDLTLLSEEIRTLLIDRVQQNGGHLASNLGVVELTIALHLVFSAPRDKIIWDVGHQCYVHKILTGRRESFKNLRMINGISGFPDPVESVYDPFIAGHAGTSISAAMGMAVARDLSGGKNHVVAVIGDGSLASGMALEAVNHLGHLGTKLTIVLNDNGMSISESAGSLSVILNTLRKKTDNNRLQKPLSFKYPFLKDRKKRSTACVPYNDLITDMGFRYLGPVNGHHISGIREALEISRDCDTGPVIVHVVTEKGKGYKPAETNATKYHGVSPNGKKSGSALTYSGVFSHVICELMKSDERIVAITAAMVDGTGLTEAKRRYPRRVFDVGICEQHGVTMAAGLAREGFIPVVAIYSTFLQRAYDQIIHDVCLQNLPVIFAIDRAGIVGDDGKTHQGAFDISFMRSMPNMIISSPKDEAEMRNILHTAVQAGVPFAIRYPRGSGEGVAMHGSPEIIPAGKSETLRIGEDLTILALGPLVYKALSAAEELAMDGIEATVINARFAKPLDREAVIEAAGRTGRLLILEENSVIGGLGSAALELLADKKLEGIRVELLGIPDEFVEHGDQSIFRSRYFLDTVGIVARVKEKFPELFMYLYKPKMEKVK